MNPINQSYKTWNAYDQLIKSILNAQENLTVEEIAGILRHNLDSETLEKIINALKNEN